MQKYSGLLYNFILPSSRARQLTNHQNFTTMDIAPKLKEAGMKLVARMVIFLLKRLLIDELYADDQHFAFRLFN